MPEKHIPKDLLSYVCLNLPLTAYYGVAYEGVKSPQYLFKFFCTYYSSVAYTCGDTHFSFLGLNIRTRIARAGSY